MAHPIALREIRRAVTGLVHALQLAHPADLPGPQRYLPCYIFQTILIWGSSVVHCWYKFYHNKETLKCTNGANIFEANFHRAGIGAGTRCAAELESKSKSEEQAD